MLKRPLLKPLIVGEAPGQTDETPSGRAAAGNGCAPLSGRCGKLLASLLGVSLEEWLTLFDRVNLLDESPPLQPGGKGRTWPLAEARAAVARLDLTGRTVVLAGKRVALAFGLRRVAWLQDVPLGRGEVRCVIVPHPSGIVRWYNAAENREAAGTVLRSCLSNRENSPLLFLPVGVEGKVG